MNSNEISLTLQNNICPRINTIHPLLHKRVLWDSFRHYSLFSQHPGLSVYSCCGLSGVCFFLSRQTTAAPHISACGYQCKQQSPSWENAFTVCFFCFYGHLNTIKYCLITDQGNHCLLDQFRLEFNESTAINYCATSRIVSLAISIP